MEVYFTPRHHKLEGELMKFVIIFLLISAKCFAQDFSGRAYSENALFYVEEHFILSKFKRRIDYKDPEGKLIAQMWIDSEDTFRTPETFFWDKRAGVYYGNSIQNHNLHLFIEPPLQNPKSLRLVHDKKYFTRAGLFDFLQGNKISNECEFIFYPSLEARRMQIIKIADKEFIEINIIPSKMIEKLFEPRLYLKFDASSGKILEYKGPSEIADDEGMYPRVEIYFDYPEN